MSRNIVRTRGSKIFEVLYLIFGDTAIEIPDNKGVAIVELRILYSLEQLQELFESEPLAFRSLEHFETVKTNAATCLPVQSPNPPERVIGPGLAPLIMGLERLVADEPDGTLSSDPNKVFN
ncbi:MAG: hypothetical protein A2754_00335 [Candidatus Magasanikbacteria bacterium RIFCSPHIGHO2_01_FULL_47_8]|uniref:Uncharacterized protein n=1 Tax=Candidatus Magasanikbacteria bacterium RIFCSPHIGHO2_01_FULL_47_8 TaxID=1798673 RepID=A0A1F6MD70_9BACT|nr:MAG: hypothetical protein A2754_00335 [Candidatus Magasanikbacteria bacterium RIFCSPHIGHO2_01_FULL_47_8]